MITIGISGGSGSGKTSVVNAIVKAFPESKISVIALDSYYWDKGHLSKEERKEINYDHPNAIEISLLIKHVKELICGKSIKMPIYSYITSGRSNETVLVKPAEILIVEGIFILLKQELLDLLNLKIFVDTENDERLMRIIGRDTIERGRKLEEVLEHYNKNVKPMHQQFIEPTRYNADLIIPKGGKNKIGIDVLNSMLKYYLKTN